MTRVIHRRLAHLEKRLNPVPRRMTPEHKAFMQSMKDEMDEMMGDIELRYQENLGPERYQELVEARATVEQIQQLAFQRAGRPFRHPWLFPGPPPQPVPFFITIDEWREVLQENLSSDELRQLGEARATVQELGDLK